MKISFNIPTYNRAKFLKKNLNILATQIIELHKENEVEINISDNASRDDTKSISEAFISAYPQLHVSYHCNEKISVLMVILLQQCIWLKVNIRCYGVMMTF